MQLPFTPEAFFEVFRLYNAAVFPWQLVLYALAFMVIPLVAVQEQLKSLAAARAIGLVLVVLWAWMGGVYHIRFFTQINPAAWLFGMLFILQAVLFLVLLVWRSPSRFLHVSRARQALGALMMLFGLLLYPLLNGWLGHGYFESPTFGTPCPTTIFTLGLLFAARNVHWSLWIVPIAWSFVGGSAAFLLAVPQDYALLVSGLAAVIVLPVTRVEQI